MTELTMIEKDQIWNLRLAAIIDVLSKYACHNLTMTEATFKIESVLQNLDQEIIDYFMSSISEIDADRSQYSGLVKFLQGKPSRQQMKRYLNSPY